MSGAVDAQAAWVQRVLGVALPSSRGLGGGTGGGTAADWPAARRAWQAASEAVDSQIAGLQAVLRRSGDDTLEEIAEFGLNGVTGNHRVRLMAALMELGSGDPVAMRKSGPKALGIVRAFDSFLGASEAIEVCDANPFGVAVSIRTTLGAALQQMATALAAGLEA
ncbi:MAG: hypothetical protein HIU82_05015 [Proteobacteria bacterium]|nr:hypothetical protein [Pseudomonadota bacterium]